MSYLNSLHHINLTPSEPLWKRVPARDAHGNPLSDFMMIIPKLKTKPPEKIREIVVRIEQILSDYAKHVVFADLNLQLNVLWISIKPVPGLILEVATVINHHIPEAKLVAQRVSA